MLSLERAKDWTLIEHCKRSGCSTPIISWGVKIHFHPHAIWIPRGPSFSSWGPWSKSTWEKKLGMLGDNAEQFVSYLQI